MAFRRLILWGSARRCLLASTLCCHAAFISGFTPGPAHQPCALRGRLERGTNLAAVESMTSAMSVAMSLVQVPVGIGGSASTIAFANWNRRFGSVVNRLRSASFGVSLVISLFLRFGADLRGMRTFAYTRLRSGSGASRGGGANIDAADDSAVHLLCQDVIETCLSLVAVGALKRIGHATFRGAKESVQKSELVVFCETQQYFAVFVELVSAICTQHFAVCSYSSDMRG